jgi:hypothetical protein
MPNAMIVPLAAPKARAVTCTLWAPRKVCADGEMGLHAPRIIRKLYRPSISTGGHLAVAGPPGRGVSPNTPAKR